MDGQREHVRWFAAQVAGEPTSVVLLEKRSVSYAVPGRYADGTVRGQGTGKQVLKTILFVPLSILAVLCALILGVLDNLGISVDFPGRRKIEVRGDESCDALGFADAIRDNEAPLWLAWSRSQMALVTAADDDQRPTLLWRATMRQRPKLTTKRSPNLRWSDGSRIDFTLPESERARITTTNGAP